MAGIVVLCDLAAHLPLPKTAQFKAIQVADKLVDTFRRRRRGRVDAVPSECAEHLRMIGV